MAPLKNNQHERFCLAILSGKNQSEAAIEAGYKPSRSRQTGCFLVTKSNILARLEGLKQAAADAKIADVVECKRVLTEIIRGRVNQYTSGNRINATINDLNSAAVAEVTTSEVQLGKGDNALTVDITKLKLRDPIAAIAELNKMNGTYAPEKHEHEVKVELDAKQSLISAINRLAARGGPARGDKQPDQERSGVPSA